MSTRSAKKWLGVAVVWLIVFGGLAGLARYYIGDNENGGTKPPISRMEPPPRETKSPTGEEPIMTKTIRFRSYTVMSYSLRDLEDLATKLVNNTGLTLRIVGHVSPGSDPDGEKKLTEMQIGKLKKIFCDKGISDNRITLETSHEPDANGILGNVATCEVYSRTQ